MVRRNQNFAKSKLKSFEAAIGVDSEDWGEQKMKWLMWLQLQFGEG